MKWKLAEAKNKLSEVINLALAEGPQEIDRRGDRIMVIDKKSYDKLIGNVPNFKKFLLSGPSFEGIDITRDSSSMRNVKL